MEKKLGRVKEELKVAEKQVGRRRRRWRIWRRRGEGGEGGEGGEEKK